jgi:antirestriction protein
MNEVKVNVPHQPIISAFITNLGKYNEGELVGKWHDFPTTKEAIAETFREIGIDGRRYEEFFITDYDSEISGITEHLSEYASIDEINYLATKIDDMVSSELEIFEAVIDSGEYCGSVQDLINLTENLDCYDYLEGVLDDSDLGYYWVEDSGCYDTKNLGSLANYIDYERFGRDIRFDEGGTFTANGYIRNNGDRFSEDYDGMNVPDEFKVFAMPKPEPRQNTPVKPKAKDSQDAR